MKHSLKNCFALLRDVEQTEEGGSYRGEEHQQTLQDLKDSNDCDILGLVQEIEDEDRIDFSD